MAVMQGWMMGPLGRDAEMDRRNSDTHAGNAAGMRNWQGWRLHRIVIGLILVLVLAMGFVGCGKSDEERWQEQYDLGVRYLDDGNYEEAIIAFNAAIEIDPKKVENYVNRAAAYYAQDNTDAAVADYTTALDLDPSMAYVYCNLADIYVAQGDYDAAVRILESGLTATSDASVQSRLDEINAEINAETLIAQVDAERPEGASEMVTLEGTIFYNGIDLYEEESNEFVKAHYCVYDQATGIVYHGVYKDVPGDWRELASSEVNWPIPESHLATTWVAGFEEYGTYGVRSDQPVQVTVNGQAVSITEADATLYYLYGHGVYDMDAEEHFLAENNLLDRKIRMTGYYMQNEHPRGESGPYSYEELHGRAATSEADLALGDDWWVYSGLYDYTFVIRSYEVME